jgi:hypothetical protein
VLEGDRSRESEGRGGVPLTTLALGAGVLEHTGVQKLDRGQEYPAPAIARQISVSRWYAGRIREGYRPHPRHWQALAQLWVFRRREDKRNRSA